MGTPEAEFLRLAWAEGISLGDVTGAAGGVEHIIGSVIGGGDKRRGRDVRLLSVYGGR